MMDCKKALAETDGDLDKAMEMLRKKGLATMEKRAGRDTTEGRVVCCKSDDGKTAAIVEVNCETDFVAKGDEFIDMANAIARRVLEERPTDMDALNALSLGDSTIGDTIKEKIAKIGENMSVRRFQIFETNGHLGVYKHGDRIGVLVDMEGGNDELAKDISMHIAASKPTAVSSDDVPSELIEKEKEIFTAQAQESGKPADIIEKMIGGRINKFLKEITLLGQPFVKDPDQTVEKLLKGADAKVLKFTRIEVGEGIEKKQDNFVEEVMAQARGE
jgi:elongation factor Ts